MQHLLCVPTGSRSDQNEDPNRAVEEWWKTAASITTSLGFWDCVYECTCVYVGRCCKCMCDCVKPQDILLFFQFILLSPAQFTLFKLLTTPPAPPSQFTLIFSDMTQDSHKHAFKFCAHSFCIFFLFYGPSRIRQSQVFIHAVLSHFLFLIQSFQLSPTCSFLQPTSSHPSNHGLSFTGMPLPIGKLALFLFPCVAHLAWQHRSTPAPHAPARSLDDSRLPTETHSDTLPLSHVPESATSMDCLPERLWNIIFRLIKCLLVELSVAFPLLLPALDLTNTPSHCSNLPPSDMQATSINTIPILSRLIHSYGTVTWWALSCDLWKAMMSHNVLLKTWQALKQSVVFKVMDRVCIVCRSTAQS